MPGIVDPRIETGELHCTSTWPDILNSQKSYILLDLFLCTMTVASLLQHGFRYCGGTLRVVNNELTRVTEAHWLNP